MYIEFVQRGAGSRRHAWGPLSGAEAKLCLARLAKDGRSRAWEAVVVSSTDAPVLPFGARPEGSEAEEALARLAQLSDDDRRKVLR